MEASPLELLSAAVCLGAGGFAGYKLCAAFKEVSSKTVRRYLGLSDKSSGVIVQPGKNAGSIYDHGEMERRVLGTYR